MTARVAVIIEKGETGYSAYVPDLPGCIAAGATQEEVRGLIKEAIEFHVEGLILHGEKVPAPTGACDYVETVMPAV